MRSFIAGAMITGQATAVINVDSRSSARPQAILAMMLAVAGVI
jgi:hypothetical protein